MRFDSLKSFLVGVGVGATVMLLFSPKSGKDTRRYIGRRVDDGREVIERGAARVRDMGQDIQNLSKQTVKRANKAFAAAVEAGTSVANGIL